MCGGRGWVAVRGVGLLLVSAGLAAGVSAADPAPDDAVQSIVVRLDVGSGGDALREPVALDLGLGFPFWLHPLGRKVGEAVPFGAVPQKSTSEETLAAGSGATFTFEIAAEPGLDKLLTTPRLLAGVRRSDITRIGFCSPGSNNWVLAGYEITVNGQTFAAASGLEAKARQTREDGGKRLGELDAEIAPLTAEKADLDALVAAKLARDPDTKRLDEITVALRSLSLEKARLEGQRAARYPWYEDPKFSPAARAKSPLGAAKVSVVTDNHSGADTSNRVYVCAGGHKLLLNAAGEPLSSARASQEFEWDLLAAPLIAADLRGWSLGMLASPVQRGSTPDRWHPERLVVTVNDRVQYDSDENPMDRNSLSAIRIIPPAQFDPGGQVTTNTPTVRETFLWEAGRGQGIDLAKGTPLELPPAGDPGYPMPEAGAGQPLAATSVPAGTAPPAGAALPTEPLPAPGGPGFDQNLFPGEQPPTWDLPALPGGGGDTGSWGGSGSTGGIPGGDVGAWGDPGPPGSMGDGSWPLPPGGSTGSAGPGEGAAQLPALPLPPGNDPPKAGDPFQIKEDSVALTAGWKGDDTFTVKWDVSGDESEIKAYEVSLVEVYPENIVPLGATVLTATVPAGTHECSGKLSSPLSAGAYYLAPIVSATPSDPKSLTLHHRIGPARAIFPAAATPQLTLANMFWVDRLKPPDVYTSAMPVSFNGAPQGTDSAVWQAAKVKSHIAMFFDQASPGWNVVARRTPGDADMTVSFNAGSLPAGKYLLVAHAGFQDGGADNAVNVSMNCRVTPQTPGATLIVPPGANPAPPPQPLEYKQKVTVTDSTAAAPPPMPLITQLIETDQVKEGTAPYNLDVRFSFAGGVADLQRPPVLYGVRLLPADAGAPVKKSLAASGAQPLPADLKATTTPPLPPPGVKAETVFPDLIGVPALGVFHSWGTWPVRTGTACFIDGDIVEVVVKNTGMAPVTTPFMVGIVKFEGPGAGAAVVADFSKPQGALQVPVPAATPGEKPGSPTPWLASAQVSTVIPPQGETTVALHLPKADIDALGEGISKSVYRVMVDSTGQINEGEIFSNAERNNWSGTFHLRKAPYIDVFWLGGMYGINPANPMVPYYVPDQPVELRAVVHGSKSWALQCNYGSSVNQKIGEEKPFASTGDQAARKMPITPWPKAGPFLQHPETMVTFTAWNSDKSRSASASRKAALLNFDGSFKIVEANAIYSPWRGGIGFQPGSSPGPGSGQDVEVSMKIESDCTAPFYLGPYGDPSLGSLYVRCRLLNPDRMCRLWWAPEDYECNWCAVVAEGKLAHSAVFSAYPTLPPPAGAELGLPMAQVPKGPLPAKGAFTVGFKIPSPPLHSIKLDFSIIVPPVPPELRMELVVHTGAKVVKAAKAIKIQDVPIGKSQEWSSFHEAYPPHDESKYLIGDGPLFEP